MTQFNRSSDESETAVFEALMGGANTIAQIAADAVVNHMTARRAPREMIGRGEVKSMKNEDQIRGRKAYLYSPTYCHRTATVCAEE